VCDDGSIFVDRDGEHFGHFFEYMRDGVVSMAEPGMRPSVSLLRALKHEFGFYCIKLSTEPSVEPLQTEMAFVVGGSDDNDNILTSMERYDASSGQWSPAVAGGTERTGLGSCAVAGELYLTGVGGGSGRTVEKYSPSNDTWSESAPMPAARSHHAAIGIA
jgi:hypothetical protein